MQRRVIILSLAGAVAPMHDSDLDRTALLEGEEPLDMGPPQMPDRIREYKIKEPAPEPTSLMYVHRERTHPTSPKQRGGRGGRW